MMMADVNKMSDSFSSLEGKYINVNKKLLQVEKCTSCGQTPGLLIYIQHNPLKALV